MVKRLTNTNKRSPQFDKLIAKIQKLVNELKKRMSLPQLSKVLGASAMFITLSTTNVDAQQFAAPVANAFGMSVGTPYQNIPALADLDGDGDLDLLTGSYYGTFNYQRNSGSATNPIFDGPITNPFGLVSATQWSFTTIGDLDNDGDLDIFVGEYSSSGVNTASFAYFENTGTATNPSFTGPTVNPFGITDAIEQSTPCFADVDGDGDLDIFSSTGEKVQYYENIGTASNPNFSLPIDNPFGIYIPPTTYYIFTVDLADIDKDGDLDLISTEYYGDFMYYQNTGTATNPNFAAPAFNPFNLMPPVDTAYFGHPEIADLDGDGDYDIVLGQYDVEDTYISLYYYENLMVSTHNENQLQEVGLNLFPNPTTSRLSITADIDNEVTLTVFDQLGRSVLTEKRVFVNSSYTVNVEQLPPGVYVLKLENEQQLIASNRFTIARE